MHYSLQLLGVKKNPNREKFPSEYESWRGMRKRCRDPRRRDFKNYGGRGISICTRWESFNCFLEDMGPKPIGTTIERKDNDGDYGPNNCIWATRYLQNLNKRNINFIDFKGQRIARVLLEKSLGFTSRRIQDRLRKGWSLDEAIMTPQRRSPGR